MYIIVRRIVLTLCIYKLGTYIHRILATKLGPRGYNTKSLTNFDKKIKTPNKKKTLKKKHIKKNLVKILSKHFLLSLT